MSVWFNRKVNSIIKVKIIQLLRSLRNLSFCVQFCTYISLRTRLKEMLNLLLTFFLTCILWGQKELLRKVIICTIWLSGNTSLQSTWRWHFCNFGLNLQSFHCDLKYTDTEIRPVCLDLVSKPWTSTSCYNSLHFFVKYFHETLTTGEFCYNYINDFRR